MDAEPLKLRKKQFALRVLNLVGALPNNVQGRAVGGQLVRAGTSAAATTGPLAADIRERNSLLSLE
jgi:hypothetical protein